MNDQQINTAIAEACGWTDIIEHPEFGLMGVNSKTHDGGRTGIEDYCNDLNAMHEAEKVLTDEQCVFIRKHLRERLENHPASRYVWNATARQRAEAFLRALGKWEDAEKSKQCYE